jgi:glutamate-ammonia-ligase adenylyltransferase
MARVLAAGHYVTGLLQHGPEAVAMFGDETELEPRPRPLSLIAVHRAVDRHLGSSPDGASLEAAAGAVRAVRRRELVRTAIADLAGVIDVDAVGQALSDATVAALDGVLRAACARVAHDRGGRLPTRIMIVGMGRLGGGELGYGSDADVMFVHAPHEGADERDAHDAAMAVAGELRRLLIAPGPDPALEVDADLRPEGRNGPLVRTLDSYAEYYRRWSLTWEAQALTRAVPVAGDEQLAADFIELVDPLRWPADGLDEPAVREIRRIKARVESERLPRGADPRRHLKLGRGGLADVEWTAQLLQLRYAGGEPSLRTPSTVEALTAAAAAGLLPEPDGQTLLADWRLASRVRNATVLWRGRPSDAFPTKRVELDGVARIVGYPPGSITQLDEDYQRLTRRARAVVERVFYD